ncbi:MAG: right-handed parallel beta-helix repeat-containing protein [Planctomycetota bacterium]
MRLVHACLRSLLLSATAAAASAQPVYIQVPSPSGGDDYPAVRTAIDTANAATSATAVLLQFQAGTYRIRVPSNQLLQLQGLDQLTVAGAGSQTTLRFTGFDPTVHSSQPGAEWRAGLQFSLCTNVVVRDLTIAAERPLASEGQLLAVDTVAHSFTLRLDDPWMFLPPGTYLAPASISVEAIFPIHPPGVALEGAVFANGIIYSPTIARIDVAPPTTSAQTVTVQLAANNDPWKLQRLATMAQHLASAPLRVALFHQYQAAWAAGGLRYRDCSDIEIRDTTIQSMNHGISIERQCDTVICERVRVEPRVDTWQVGSTRGGFGGIYGVRGPLVFRDSHLIGLFDDGIDVVGHMWAKVSGNAAGMPMSIVSIRANGLPTDTHIDDGLDPSRWGSGSMRAGDAVWVYSSDLSTVLGRATLQTDGQPQNPGANPQGPWDLYLVNQNPPGFAANLPADVAVSLRGNVFDSVLIEGCTFTGGKGSGVMLSGPNVTVRGNTFRNVGFAAIRVHTILDRGADETPLNVIGPPVTDTVIEDNTIVGGNGKRWSGWPWLPVNHWGSSIANIEVTAILADGGAFGTIARAPAHTHRRVTIQRNVIRDTELGAMCVTSAGSVLIDSNVVDAIATGYAPTDPAIENSLLYLENCANVRVSNNSSATFPAPPPHGIRVGPNVTGLHDVNNRW